MKKSENQNEDSMLVRIAEAFGTSIDEEKEIWACGKILDELGIEAHGLLTDDWSYLSINNYAIGNNPITRPSRPTKKAGVCGKLLS